MPRDRYALSFDSEQDCVGETALRLLRHGIDVLHAGTADEALLMADEAGDRIHAVIVPASVEIDDLDRVVGRIPHSREGQPPAVVVVGDKPADEVRANLRSAGAEWAVWNPPEENALRFAVNAAMALPSELVPRQEIRFPTHLMASFHAGDSPGDAVAYTLSARGAFLETPQPLPIGTGLQVEIFLPGLRVDTRARVLYLHEPDAGRRSRQPIGMGVVFHDLGEKQESRIRSFIGERADSMTV